MPNIKAAVKWERQSRKRTTRNKDAKTRLKTLFKKASAESAAEIGSAYDKAAGKGIIHKNKAARKKSRLARALSKVAVAAPAAKPARARKTATKTSAKKK